METKASYLIVGGFVLAMAAAVFAVVMWLARFHGQEDVTLYYIYFRGSVTGLQVGSAVRYRGVSVGTVRDIQIDAKNVELIEVTAAIRAGTPIKTDTVAQLQLQGITGVSFVQLSGGKADSLALQPAPGKRRAVIQSMPSPIERVVESAPELLMQLVMLASRASEILSDDNKQRIENILVNVDRLTAALAADPEGLKRVLEATPGLFAQISALSGRITQLLDDQNQQRLANIIVNADRLTGSLAANAEALKNVVDAAPALLAQLSALTTRLAATVDESNQQKIASILANVDRLTGDPEGLKKALDAAPGVLTEISALTARLGEALSEPNQQKLASILANVDRATALLASDSDGLRRIIADTTATLAVLRETGTSVTKLANDLQGHAQRLTDGTDQALGHVNRLAGDIGGTAGRLGATADQAVATAAKLLADIGGQAKRLVDNAEQTLAGISRLTGDLSASAGQITGGVNRTLGDVSSLATALKADALRLIDDADTTVHALRRTVEQVGGEAQQTVRNASQATGDIRNAATSFARLAAQLDRLVVENRLPVREFASNGLYELSQFLIDARTFVGNMNRVLNQFERDPARFLFGDQAKGYEAK